jgi:hypothetical protein
VGEGKGRSDRFLLWIAVSQEPTSLTQLFLGFGAPPTRIATGCQCRSCTRPSTRTLVLRMPSYVPDPFSPPDHERAVSAKDELNP